MVVRGIIIYNILSKREVIWCRTLSDQKISDDVDFRHFDH